MMSSIRTICFACLAISISSANAYGGQRIWNCSGEETFIYYEGTKYSAENDFKIQIREQGKLLIFQVF